jgi:hypothetical protein
MNDPRYASGTSLTRTDKEEVLDDLDGMLDLTDEEFLALKRLTREHLRSLVIKVRVYGSERYELGWVEARRK